MARSRNAQAAYPAAPPGAFGEREHTDVLRSIEQARGLGRILDDAEAAGLRGRLEGEARLDRHLVGRGKAGQQLTELEVIEDAPRLVVVVSRPPRPLELQVDRHLANDRHHPLAQPDLVRVGDKRGLEPAFGQLADPLQERLHAHVVLDQLGRRLVAHPGHARDVVRRIAAERLEVDQLRRLEAVALADLLGAVDERVRDAAARHQRIHRFGDQLEAVQIARDDGDRVAALLGDAREGADHVIRLEAFDAVDRDGERFQHLAHHLDLRPEVVGHGAPPGLVFLVFQGAERWFAEVEGGDRVLRPRGEDDRQHRRKAVDGIGHPAV